MWLLSVVPTSHIQAVRESSQLVITLLKLPKEIKCLVIRALKQTIILIFFELDCKYRTHIDSALTWRTTGKTMTKQEATSIREPAIRCWWFAVPRSSSWLLLLLSREPYMQVLLLVSLAWLLQLLQCIQAPWLGSGFGLYKYSQAYQSKIKIKISSLPSYTCMAIIFQDKHK